MGLGRSFVIDKLWEKAEPTLFISKEQFIASLDGWTIEGLEIDGELAFVGMQKGPEFHFQNFGAKHRITMKMAKAYLQPLITQYGYVMTRTPKDDARQHRFNRRFGFEITGEDEFDVHYRLERIRPCP
jgi:hypothetical protein